MVLAVCHGPGVGAFPAAAVRDGYVRPTPTAPAASARPGVPGGGRPDRRPLGGRVSGLSQTQSQGDFRPDDRALIVFGFVRNGCICPIGSIQNVTMTLFDSGYALPIAVLVFFAVPLVFTLFFGRVFCGAVCPLGAIQDAVLLHPVRVPRWLESSLRLMAYIYLGAAVLFAATGGMFIICRYDPFVGFFRLTGDAQILLLGACLLVIGLFVGRPYCRFLCPYGVILRQLSRLSKWRVTITPDECIKCRLCEDSCPFGAIREPTEPWPQKQYRVARTGWRSCSCCCPSWRRGAWGGYRLRDTLARVHPQVRTAERVNLEQSGAVEGTDDLSDAFRATGRDSRSLSRGGADPRHLGLGGAARRVPGLVVGGKLLSWRSVAGG